MVTSSGSDTYSVVAAALASLKGPKHGGANIKVVEMMADLKREVRDLKDEDEIAAYLLRLLNRDAFDKKGLIYGMGHAVYSISDPRALIFRNFVARLAAEKGCIGICWSNTAPNMPAWGAKDCRIGNNPLILAVPRSDGQHVMVDCALSQFSYGKLESTRLAGRQLPVPGGCDEDGQLTTDPAAIEKSGRALPIGYWKGSGLSILLDLIATLLSGGNAVHTIGTFGDEIGLTQIMIAIDPTKFGTVEENDAVIDAILADIKASTPARPDGEVRWPGEGMLRTIKENRELGVPVVEEIWESVLKM